MSSTHKGVRCFTGSVDPDAFRLQIFPDGIDSAFAAEAGTFVSAERRHVADRPVHIDPDCTGFQSFRHGDCPANARGPDSGSQTIYRAVRDAYSPVFIVEGNDRENRPENLLI